MSVMRSQTALLVSYSGLDVSDEITNGSFGELHPSRRLVSDPWSYTYPDRRVKALLKIDLVTSTR